MNEEKLREAAETALKKVEGSNISLWDVPDNYESREYWKEIFIESIKSDAAKQYWQEQQVLDVEELRKEFIDKFKLFNDSHISNVFDFFLPRLKQSDSVEFAEWIGHECWDCVYGNLWALQNERKTTQELYQLFKTAPKK